MLKVRRKGGEEGKRTKRKSKASKGRNREANYMTKGVQEMIKTGQRKRRKMAVIKSPKQGSKQKGEEGAKNKVEEGPKTRAKKRQKGKEN